MHIIEKTYRWSGKLDNRSSTKQIILHHADAKTCSPDDIHKWHLANGWCGIGYHFVVRKDGVVYRGRPEDAVGAHAYGSNADSIGICFEGDFDNEIMPEAQAVAGYELVKLLKARYNIAKVVRHRDVGDTDCPGEWFPFKMISTGEGIEPETPERKVSVELREIYANHRGADVKAMQTLLELHGHSVGKCGGDGINGEDTQKALIAFQTKCGLSPDCICGRLTWAALLS